jgi:hypothetical protein
MTDAGTPGIAESRVSPASARPLAAGVSGLVPGARVPSRLSSLTGAKVCRFAGLPGRALRLSRACLPEAVPGSGRARPCARLVAGTAARMVLPTETARRLDARSCRRCAGRFSGTRPGGRVRKTRRSSTKRFRGDRASAALRGPAGTSRASEPGARGGRVVVVHDRGSGGGYCERRPPRRSTTSIRGGARGGPARQRGRPGARTRRRGTGLPLTGRTSIAVALESEAARAAPPPPLIGPSRLASPGEELPLPGPAARYRA